VREGPDAVAVVGAETAALDFQLDQLAGALDREEPQQDLVGEAEQGRVRPDAESEGEDGDAGEERCLREGSHGQAHFPDGAVRRPGRTKGCSIAGR
jgi:hypothetical protein